MGFNRDILKRKRNYIVAVVAAVIVICFSSLAYYEDRFYDSENIFKSKNVKIGYNNEAESKAAHQALWWNKDFWRGVTLNKSADLSDKVAEVYVKTGWNDTNVVDVTKGQSTEIKCYGPTMLGARLDAGTYDVDGDGKKEQVHYYAQITENGEGFDGDGHGDENGDEDRFFNNRYGGNNGYMKFRYMSLTFEDTEKMSLGIIQVGEGAFQVLFRGVPLGNTKINVTSEFGLNEIVTTNQDGYFYVNDLRAAASGLNIVYIDNTLEEGIDTYHILNYKAQNIDNIGIFSAWKLVLMIIIVILGVLGVNKFLSKKRRSVNTQLLFEMDDLIKED